MSLPQDAERHGDGDSAARRVYLSLRLDLITNGRSNLTRRGYSRTTFFLSTLLACIVVVAGCGKPKGEQKQQTMVATTPVDIAVAHRQTLFVTKQFSGTLEGEEQANIVPKISERITALNVQVGESVKAGQVLVELDKSGATSQFYQAQAAFNNAEKTFERMKALYDDGAISLQSLDGTQTAYEVAKANFEGARSSVELATPIPGVVTAVNVNMGDLTTPSEVLMTVAKINRMKVNFDVNENELSNLNVGHNVQVYSEDRPGTRVNGEITQLSKSADVRSRSFQLKATFNNTPDNWFRPGMFCRVNVPISSQAGTLTIPSAAVLSDGITSRVFVARKGRSYQQIVRVGVTDGKSTEVLDGLLNGDTVVTTGATTARDSGYVSIVSK